jgi:hypothetical protein
MAQHRMQYRQQFRAHHTGGGRFRR